LVFAAASAFRPDVADAGPGYWVMTPAQLADGSIVIVNRGFVPDGRQDPQSRRDGEVSGPLDIVGALRWPQARHWFTPNDDPAHNLWFTADPASIAAAKAIGQGGNVAPADVAPFYVEQAAPVPPGGLPLPGRLVVDLPDNHLQYALTWFGLAAVLVGVFVSWAFTSRSGDAGGNA
jgi:surfeit locus 1 family protein